MGVDLQREESVTNKATASFFLKIQIICFEYLLKEIVTTEKKYLQKWL